MVSHLVGRRWFSPYGVILYHPCGSHSWADFEAAQQRSFGRGDKCPGCAQSVQQRMAAGASG